MYVLFPPVLDGIVHIVMGGSVLEVASLCAVLLQVQPAIRIKETTRTTNMLVIWLTNYHSNMIQVKICVISVIIIIAYCNGLVVIPRKRQYTWLLVMAFVCVVLLQVQPAIRIKETTRTTNMLVIWMTKYYHIAI